MVKNKAYRDQQPIKFTNKAGPIKVHALMRMRERFDALADRYAMYAMGRQIRDGGGSTFVERLSKRTSIHIVTHNGQSIKVVYDNRRKLVVTVMYDK
jgi:hypothetical protein